MRRSVPLLLLIPCCGLLASAEHLELNELEPIERIVFQQSGGLGFCPDDELPLRAELRSAPAGWVIEGTHTSPNCRDADCGVPFGPAPVSTADVDAIEDLIRELPGRKCRPDPLCDGCLSKHLTVNDAAIEGTCCGKINGGFSRQFGEIVDRIAALGQ